MRDTGDKVIATGELPHRHDGLSFFLRTLVKIKMPVSDSLEAIAMRQEAKRFESLCPNIQSLYDLLEQIDNVPLKRKMRELVNRIEGKLVRLSALKYNFPNTGSGAESSEASGE